MSRGLTPAQRLAYEALRLLAQEIVSRHPSIAPRVLADAVGVQQPTVSNVLKGRMTSVVTLAQIARVVMPMVSADDQRRLGDELARVMPIVRKPRATPPSARPPPAMPGKSHALHLRKGQNAACPLDGLPVVRSPLFHRTATPVRRGRVYLSNFNRWLRARKTASPIRPWSTRWRTAGGESSRPDYRRHARKRNAPAGNTLPSRRRCATCAKGGNEPWPAWNQRPHPTGARK